MHVRCKTVFENCKLFTIVVGIRFKALKEVNKDMYSRAGPASFKGKKSQLLYQVPRARL